MDNNENLKDEENKNEDSSVVENENPEKEESVESDDIDTSEDLKSEKEEDEIFEEESQEEDENKVKPNKAKRKEIDSGKVALKQLKVKRFLSLKDAIIMIVMTLIVGITMFSTLGTMDSPKTSFVSEKGDAVRVTRNAGIELSEVWIYSEKLNNKTGVVSVFLGNSLSFDELGVLVGTFYLSDINVFEYKKLITNSGSYDKNSLDLTFVFYDEGLVINEIVLIDSTGNKIVPSEIATEDGSARGLLMFDEQSTFYKDTRYYSLQSSEKEYAIAGYEYANGFLCSQTGLLPLNYAISSLGIKMFGVNPFGFRFMSALFGLLTVPLVYMIGKLLFKKEWLALLMGGLYVVSGLSLSSFSLATSYNMLTFLLLAGYTLLIMFTRYSTARKLLPKHIALLVFACLSFSVAMTVNLWAMTSIIGCALLLTFQMLDGIGQSDEVASKGGTKYEYKKNLVIISLVSAVVLMAVSALLYLWSYGITAVNHYVYDYGKVYMEYIGTYETFLDNQPYIIDALIPEVGEGTSFIYWLIGRGGDTLVNTNNQGAATQVFRVQNFVLCIFALCSMIYFAVYFIICSKRRKEGGLKKPKLYKYNIRTATTLIICFMACLCPYFFSYEAITAAFMPASVFYIGFLTLFARQSTRTFTKSLFTIKSHKVSIGETIVYAMIMIVLGYFIGIIPTIYGI